MHILSQIWQVVVHGLKLFRYSGKSVRLSKVLLHFYQPFLSSSLIAKKTMEDVFFGVSGGVSGPCFSSALDGLPDWEDSWFSLGDGCVEKQVTACHKSPGHESDSGLSSVYMSDVRSPLSLSGEDVVMDFQHSDDYQTMELKEEKPLFDEDSDLLSFLMNSDGADAEDKPGSSHVEQSATDSESLDCNMNVKDTKSFENSYSMDGNQIPKLAKSPVVLCEKIDANTVAKQSDKIVIAPLSTKNSGVKVVKLVTPVAVGKPVTTDDVVKAIEVKNKKNAQNAKINREKKKTYIKGLEDTVDCLKTENNSLKEEAKALKKEKCFLEEEVSYLKSVLANESSLSALLQNIPCVKKVNLSSSFLSSKRNAEEDHDYESPAKKCRKGGVCLHVEGENVSLEFCSRCAKMASKSDVDK